MTELDDIYSPELLEISANISRTQRLKEPDATSSVNSKLCGSKITVDLCVKDNVITDFGQDIEACLLGQSSAAIVAENIIGIPTSEIQQVGDQMRNMLKNGDPAPEGKWEKLGLLKNVQHFRARHASTLLVFDALDKAIESLKSEQSKEQE